MRNITSFEMSAIAGGDLHTHVVLQPTGPINRDGFRSDMVVLGMIGGGLVGGVVGTLAMPVVGTLAGCAIGLVPGGMAGRAAAEFSIGVYDMTMMGSETSDVAS